MKRDCGPGNLIPIRYSVVFCIGANDEETEIQFQTLERALIEFDNIKETIISNTRGSNVRLYASDRQGYSNCVKSFSFMFNNKTYSTDRTSELN